MARPAATAEAQAAPLISVIIPCYNVAPWAERCIRSVLAQEGVRLEVVAVDDRSGDGTGALLDDLALGDARLKVLHLPANVGLHAARRAGFQAATGALIGFVDGDDHVDPAMYARLAGALVRTGADIALGGWRAAWEDGQEESAFNHPAERVITDDLPGRFARFEFGKGVVWNKLYRRAIITPAMGMELDRALDSGADYLIGFGNFMRAEKVVTVPGALYHYALRRASMSNAMDRAKAFTHLLACYAAAVTLYAPEGETLLAAIDESYRRQLHFSGYRVDHPADLQTYGPQLARAMARLAEHRPQAIHALVRTFDPEATPLPPMRPRYYLGQARAALRKALRAMIKGRA